VSYRAYTRYEGAHVVQREGFFYLFASATDCCRGPLTGYSVFVGRSQNVLGPYVDRDGQPLLQGRVGGTPVLSMNGNRWVGTGHNTVITDAAGQWWTLYHAVDRTDPYFEGAVGFTKRPLLLDPITWTNGWPDVRDGLWASDTPQPEPASRPEDRIRSEEKAFRDARVGQRIAALSDEFDGAALAPRWSWVRQPAPGTYGVAGIKYLFYGSYFGGISARQLTPDELRSAAATQTQITIANRSRGRRSSVQTARRRARRCRRRGRPGSS